MRSISLKQNWLNFYSKRHSIAGEKLYRFIYKIECSVISISQIIIAKVDGYGIKM